MHSLDYGQAGCWKTRRRHGDRILVHVQVQFGAWLRQIRHERGISQERLAELAGLHRTYVSSIELGKVQVSIRIAEQLAKALELPLSELWRDIEQDRA